MKTILSHILAIVALLVSLAGCSRDEENIISRGDMAEIYAEMLLLDQWLNENQQLRHQADTSLVYEPIFARYGYTTEDYRASVAYYMNDPERYSRILRETVEILDEKLIEARELKAIEDRLKAIKPYKIDRNKVFYFRVEDGTAEYGDTVSVAVDSFIPIYTIRFHEIADSLFDGLNVIGNPDSIVVKDTLTGKEAVKVHEKPAVEDSAVVKGSDYLKMYSTMSLDTLKRK